MAALKPLFSWRSAICDSSLPPTTRHVAMSLSLYMNERGDSAFPGPTRLAHDTGLSLRAVKEHLHLLVEQGWLVITEHGGIKGEKRRANAYQASTPVQERTRARDAPVTLTTGTRADEREVPVQEVHPNSSLELSMNSTRASEAECSPALAEQETANNAERERKLTDEELASQRAAKTGRRTRTRRVA